MPKDYILRLAKKFGCKEIAELLKIEKPKRLEKAPIQPPSPSIH
jgi:hypothetical protein